jgi:hypothetical protein
MIEKDVRNTLMSGNTTVLDCTGTWCSMNRVATQRRCMRTTHYCSH